MSKTLHEKRVLASVQGIQSAVEAIGGYVETLVFPAYDFGNGDNVIFEAHPTKRGRILEINVLNLTEAIANSPTVSVGETDVDAYVKALTYPTTSANTNDTTDQDGAVDLTRLILPGVTVTIPASQLVTLTGTDPGTGAGVGDVVVVVQYFE